MAIAKCFIRLVASSLWFSSLDHSGKGRLLIAAIRWLSSEPIGGLENVVHLLCIDGLLEELNSCHLNVHTESLRLIDDVIGDVPEDEDIKLVHGAGAPLVVHHLSVERANLV